MLQKPHHNRSLPWEAYYANCTYFQCTQSHYNLLIRDTWTAGILCKQSFLYKHAIRMVRSTIYTYWKTWWRQWWWWWWWCMSPTTPHQCCLKKNKIFQRKRATCQRFLPKTCMGQKKEETYVERWGITRCKRWVWWGKPRGGVKHGMRLLVVDHLGLWA